ncbi:hypothetical protein AN640_06650 [Candidatus Epulonipiscium fishelsonii]|uniref:Uncharacterized protein n=1 Tax=Candidatus Epulonipiscium fishelsonii TaxID=77094 RepID=A0ACC8XHG9_9FIRM|nr:hypothetical protein AN640_06650 [Epulopiscium sp. SCG-D08WGA-EpuloA1]
MNKRLKNMMMSFAVSCCLYSPLAAMPQAEINTETPITMYIDGKQISTPLMSPIILEGTTLVPIREVFEPLGASVEWYAEGNQTIITYKDKYIELQPNAEQIQINGEMFQLPIATKIMNGKVLVPIRFISEQMGFQVEWDENLRSINLMTNQTQEIDIDNQAIAEATPIEVATDNQAIEEAAIIEVATDNQAIEEAAIIEALPDQELTEVAIAEEPPISLYVDGNQIPTPLMPPIIYEGTTLVPIREVFEPLGATVEWRATDNRTIITYYDTSIILQPNSRYIQVNGKTVPLPTSTKVINNKVMVPIRFISEQMGFEVEWDGNLRSIELASNSAAQNKVQTFMSSNNKVNKKSEYDVDVDKNNIINIADIIEKPIEVNPKPNFIFDSTIEHPLAYDMVHSNIILDNVVGLDINKVSIEDKYRERKLIIDLGAKLPYENETLLVEDGLINAITIVTGNTTKVIVDQAIINTCQIRQNTSKFIIDIMRPQEKYDEIVVIDIGHGGEDPGAVNENVEEKDLNTVQAMEVKDLLEQNTDIKVYMTRETDETLTLDYRTSLSNEIDADLFVSFHNNSASSDAKGTEVYYKSDDSSEMAAEIILNNVINYTGMFNRGAKLGDTYYVLRNSDMPAILLEGGFISSSYDLPVIDTPWFTEEYGKAVYDGIVEYFNTYN